jgi:predicted ArsR family transcriptional regulator
MDKLTYQQAAKELNTSVQALRNKVSNLSIILAKEGNRAYFTREQIEKLKPQPDNSIVNVYLELSGEQAEALSQFCKRASLNLFEGVAQKDTNQAELMREAVYVLGKALADAGYNPR